MPVISMFYGIIVRMFFYDNKRHHLPHIHIEYQDYKAVISIPDCEVLDGKMPNSQLRLVSAWIEIHKEELLADWKLATEGQKIFTIEGLK